MHTLNPYKKLLKIRANTINLVLLNILNMLNNFLFFLKTYN
jgi:hypothetical protein